MENYMNRTKKPYSVCAVSLALLCSVPAAFSQGNPGALKEFVKENIRGKTRIVKNLNGYSIYFADTSLYAFIFLYDNLVFLFCFLYFIDFGV